MAIYSIFPYPGRAVGNEHGNMPSAGLSLHWCIFYSYRSPGILELETAFGMLHLTGPNNLSYLF